MLRCQKMPRHQSCHPMLDKKMNNYCSCRQRLKPKHDYQSARHRSQSAEPKHEAKAGGQSRRPKREAKARRQSAKPKREAKARGQIIKPKREAKAWSQSAKMKLTVEYCHLVISWLGTVNRFFFVHGSCLWVAAKPGETVSACSAYNKPLRHSCKQRAS